MMGILHKIRELLEKHPARSVLLGYVIYSLIGWALLSLPICHVNSVHIIDNFFTATSATTTAGLTTVDISREYTFLGQLVILLLMQYGGLGYMTFSTFVVLATTHKLSSYREKMTLGSFSLPHDFSIKEFLNHVIIFTFIAELVGAIALSIIFMHRGVENFIWSGIFHSVSAFCTVGLSLFPDNFTSFQYDFAVNAVISLLSIVGAVGFIVWINLYKRVTGKTQYITFISKLILILVFSFLVVGTLLFSFTESPRTEYESLITSFFQVMSASTTAGFNTLDIGQITTANIILLFFLMAFGASPSGTGGGLKNTTFAALLILVKTTLLGRHHFSLLHREILPKRIQLAAAIFAYYSCVMFICVFILVLVEEKAFLPLLFEASSALGNIGLTMGITPTLSSFGKVLISIMMLMGRAGILTFGIALSVKTKEKREIYKTDNELVF